MILLTTHGGTTLWAHVFIELNEQFVCIEILDASQTDLEDQKRFDCPCGMKAMVALSELENVHTISSGMTELAKALREELRTLGRLLSTGPDISHGWHGSRSSRRPHAMTYA